MRKLSSLSAFAYLIPSVTRDAARLLRSHRVRLVTTSLALKRADAPSAKLDRARLAEALLSAPAAPPFPPAALRPVPPPAARRPPALPPAPARAVESSVESAPPSREALDSAVVAILNLGTPVSADPSLAENKPFAAAAAWRRTPAGAAARVARAAASAATSPVSLASAALLNLSAAAAPLVAAAAAGSSGAALALAQAAAPLAALAASGSGVATSALGSLLEPVAAAAAAGGSAAGATLASVLGAAASAATSAASRIGGGRALDAAGSTLAAVAGGASNVLQLSSGPQVKPAAAPLAGGCPCEWFIADDVSGGTRLFVIQGSDSVASWRSNLSFDPVPFEDAALETSVHRGVYEAALALYETLTPFVDDFLAAPPRRGSPLAASVAGAAEALAGGPRIAFTGHSLGGSLATLVSLMLAHRRPALRASLDPVYTFGSPSVFCESCCGGAGGCEGCEGALLRSLGLPCNHVRNVMLHLDVVPRAFACDYRLVQSWLRRVGGGFREHRCLEGSDHRVSLYTPVGATLVLQPAAEHAAQHVLLPHGAGLWAVEEPAESKLAQLGVSWALGGNGGKVSDGPSSGAALLP